MDDCLNWLDHVTGLSVKLGRIQYLFKRLTKFLTKEVLRDVYFAYVESIIRYGIVLWGSSSHAVTIFRMQKRFLRLMNGKSLTHTCRGLFRSSNVLTLTGIYVLELSLLARKMAPTWETGAKVHGYATRHNSEIRLDYHRTSAFESSPLYRAKMTYNKLPPELRAVVSLHVFKHKLKAWLCEKEFYSLNEF